MHSSTASSFEALASILLISRQLISRQRSRELKSLRRALLIGVAFGSVILNPFAISTITAQNSPDAAQTTTINFDNLPTGIIVTNQYPQVRFSGTNFSGGQGGPQGYDVYTQSVYGIGGSSPNTIFSTYNPSFYNYGYARGQGPLFLDFTVPVSNVNSES
jgi:hypothetical protein